ncbi:MAG TPA: ABATE domain-containing protein [Actinomycetes bacterium]
MTAKGELPDQLGGRLCLDFLNSVDPRHAAGRHEFFTSYADLLAWGRSVEVLPPGALRTLTHRAAADPTAAAAAHRYALAFRESLYQVVAASLEGRQVFPDDLARVNRVLRRATGRHQLLPGTPGGVRDGWVLTGDLDELLWPVAVDAWDVLTGPSLERVHECPGDDGACGWLFLDTSRSGTRRWCDMRTCGNRAKVRAHYRARTPSSTAG